MSPTTGLDGLMLTPLTTGGVLEMVTVLEAMAAPSSSPSLGVTAQTTSWSRSKLPLSRVSPVAAWAAPSTVHA